MHLFLFIILVIFLFIAVRIGAIAFELTGLTVSVAKFQSISCFTGTGFTTRESELIAGNPQRRRIASVLMILGYAGFASLIASFVNTMKVPEYIDHFSIPFIDFLFPAALLPLVNLTVVLFVTLACYKLIARSRLANDLSERLKLYFMKRGFFAAICAEQLMVTSGGSGIVSVDIKENSHVLDKTITDSYFKESNINILAVVRKGEIISVSPPGMQLTPGDRLICSGKMESIMNVFFACR
ncbi:MAG: TrkA C-terminal domain-containing protein [Candidatus Omnitrophica bacterium]|nr:TrkA C-terminal domain-containing protein [Candidatus Omnitrophota bacterium]MBU1869476.1 TrkA C-terminal domain-containing protein [Candidatus Omnitrophota bacterium]